MNRDRIIAALRQHETELRALGVQGLVLFGSVARGQATETSDVDIMVELEPAYRGFRRLAQLDLVRDRIAAILGRDVDLIEPPARSNRLYGEIERDACRAL